MQNERCKPPRTCWKANFNRQPEHTRSTMKGLALARFARFALGNFWIRSCNLRLAWFRWSHSCRGVFELWCNSRHFERISLSRLDGFMLQTHVPLSTTATCIDFSKITASRHLRCPWSFRRNIFLLGRDPISHSICWCRAGSLGIQTEHFSHGTPKISRNHCENRKIFQQREKRRPWRECQSGKRSEKLYSSFSLRRNIKSDSSTLWKEKLPKLYKR